MKNRIIGLGIFALVFSLNLLFSGAVEAKQVSQEVLCSTLTPTHQEDLFNSGELTVHNGILQHRTETSELHHVVRKYPAVLSVLFLLLNQNVVESLGQIVADDRSLLLFKNLSVAFRNLRI